MVDILPCKSLVNKPFLSAIILAGGKSSRMNYKDKGLLCVKNQQIIKFVINHLSKNCAEIIISANQNNSKYAAFGYQVYPDIDFIDMGPLGGIYQCLQYVKYPYVIISPCDTPILPDNYVIQLLQALTQQQADIAVSEINQQIQPAHLLIKTTLKTDIKNYLETGQRSLHGWLKRHKYTCVPFTKNKGEFLNLNSEKEIILFSKLN